MHCRKRGVEALAHILVRRVWKFVKDSNDSAVSSKSFRQDVMDCDMSGQFARTLNLYPIIEDTNVDVVRDAVVAVQHRIGDYLVKGFGWVFDLF